MFILITKTGFTPSTMSLLQIGPSVDLLRRHCDFAGWSCDDVTHAGILHTIRHSRCRWMSQCHRFLPITVHYRHGNCQSVSHLLLLFSRRPLLVIFYFISFSCHRSTNSFLALRRFLSHSSKRSIPYCHIYSSINVR